MQNVSWVSSLFGSLGAIALAIPTASSFAADLTADAHIDHVTVYRQGAVVNRVAELVVPAGTHRVIFRDLPADVDAKTLQISADNAGIQLGDIEVVRINAVNFVSAPESELRRKIEEAGDQQAALRQHSKTISQLHRISSSCSTHWRRTRPAVQPRRRSIVPTLALFSGRWQPAKVPRESTYEKPTCNCAVWIASWRS
jgi:hypothetical protein